MKCICKVLSVNGIPASDGSLIPFEVMKSYLESNECKKALEDRTMIGGLTHRGRNISAVFPDKPELKKTVGKDDLFNFVSEEAPAPTHYISKLYIENDGWLYAELTFLDESVMDDITIQNLRRIKGLLKNGVKEHVSIVLLAYWSGDNGLGTDVCKKIVSAKGIDFTNNSSWKDAGITEIIDDDEKTEKHYSEVDFNSDEVKVKTFSDISKFGDYPKSSKIDGQFTFLKAKEFSSYSSIDELVEDAKEQMNIPQEKTFTQAGVRDRLRDFKMSPRMSFRRICISYKQVIRQMGGIDKADPNDIKILKSMFTKDILILLNQIHPEIMKGKQINTLLGCSSISKSAREAAQRLQIPYRYAVKEAEKNGFISKMRYQKLETSYTDFIKSLVEDIFGNTDLIEGEEDQK